MNRGLQIIHTGFCYRELIFVLVLAVCCGIFITVSASTTEHAFYSETYDMPLSQSPENLSSFLTDTHLDYDLYGYNFFASLIDNPDEIHSFFMGLEQKGPKASAAVGFRGRDFENISLGNTGKTYRWSGFENDNLEMTTNPWSVQLTDPNCSSCYIRVELISGRMGSDNATYRLTADTRDESGKLIKADVLLHDSFGAVNQGYGTTSFFPQYLTDTQREDILKLPEKTVGNYLTSTHDPMHWQGDYYYALPMMDVLSYTIEFDGKIASGRNGKSWLDYFVQSYNRESLSNMTGSRWNWIAIQMPDIHSAINLLDLSNDKGQYSAARLFNNSGEKSKNGAHIASHSWEIDTITVDPVEGSEWTSPTGKKYFLTYNITLESSTLPGNLLVEVFKNQELVLSEEQTDYQGLGNVTGKIGDVDIGTGQAWLEFEAM